MDSKIIIRNDDVSPSTNMQRLSDMYKAIKVIIPDAKIISGITIFGRTNNTEAIYPDLPLKTKSKKYLYDVNSMMYNYRYVVSSIASHGLFHVQHSTLSKDAQEMSIVGSCRLLGTNQFIAPFNYYNDDTIAVCRENNIELLTTKYEWKSFEHNKFDSTHKYWYFHSWKYSIKELQEYLNDDIANSFNMG